MRSTPTRRNAARTVWISALGLVACAQPVEADSLPGARHEAGVGAAGIEQEAARDVGLVSAPAGLPSQRPVDRGLLSWADLSAKERELFMAALNEDHLAAAFGDRSAMRFDPTRVASLVAEWTSIHDELDTVHEELAAEAEAIREKLRGSPQHRVHPSPECELECGFFGAQVSGLFRLPLIGSHPGHIEWVEFSLADQPAFARVHRRCAELGEKRAALLTRATTALAKPR